MQLVFGRDSLLNLIHVADWEFIRDRKQQIIKNNNQRENASRLDHTYQVGDMVLIKAEQRTKYGSDSYLGPYQVVSVHDNGTVRVREGTLTDVYNIRNVVPYKS